MSNISNLDGQDGTLDALEEKHISWNYEIKNFKNILPSFYFIEVRAEFTLS